MSLQAYVEKRQSEGVASAREIHAEIVRPSVVVTTGKEARTTANLEAQFRDLVVPALMTANLWNTTAPDARDELIDARLEQRMGVLNLPDADFLALLKTEARMRSLRKRIERRGGDATGPDAGKGERDTVTTSEGPALWQTWGIERPTVAQVRGLMQ